ncbi:ankyrin repeat domain-containing protein [Providencia rettgeri]
MKVFCLLFCLLVVPMSTVQASNDDDEKHVKQQLNNYLWNAARSGNNDILNDFIASKYDLNVQDEKGYTAVILASYHGHQTAVENLLKAGADPCLLDKRGNSALMGAIFKGEVRIANQLIAAECNPDTRNNAGQTAAMYAALFQQQSLLEQLKAKGADMNVTDINGNNVAGLVQGEINSH